MKIYNKKKFADGCFFLVLGAALAGAMIWKREIDGKSVVLALIALVIGADALVRSLSRRLSYQDKVEALDERNIQVELRARSRTLSLLRGTLMAVLILSLIGALANPEGELVYGGMMVVSGVLYTLSLFIDLACASIMKAGYRDRITEDPDEKESEEFHMSHTREEEWKQVRALHLVRDERDREVGAAAKGRAGGCGAGCLPAVCGGLSPEGGPGLGRLPVPHLCGGRGAVPSSVLGG